MNVSIVVFSPSGHTLKAAEMIKNAFENRGNCVRLVNITGKNEFLYGSAIKENLEKAIGEYDVLFIGGPLYAGHVEHHIIDVIRALPKPNQKYSNLAVPFVTYGGVHSSVALEEMGRYLKRQKHKSILGIKIAAKHSLTTTFSNIIYEDRPGIEEKQIIEEAVDSTITIIKAGKDTAIDQSKSFKYAPTKERIIFRIMSQEKIHKKFKNVTINAASCIKCNKCIEVCPVNMFKSTNGEIIMHRDNNCCILCAECFHNCPVGAIEHTYMEMAKIRLKDGLAEMEKVPSGIYQD